MVQQFREQPPLGGGQLDLGDIAEPAGAAGYSDYLYGGEIHHHIAQADLAVSALRALATRPHDDSCLP
jgi:hypothetical protein